jgi:hypothetical protein
MSEVTLHRPRNRAGHMAQTWHEAGSRVTPQQAKLNAIHVGVVGRCVEARERVSAPPTSLQSALIPTAAPAGMLSSSGGDL